jgi:glc operon protein GlcG
MDRRPLLIAALATLAAFPARAQLASRPVLTLQAAKAALAAAEAEAARNGWRVAIAVVDDHGELFAFSRDDGAALTTIAIAQGKARTAARGRRATKAYEDLVAGGRTVLLRFDEVLPVQGGVPIVVNGVVVGGIGVSGATSAQDEQAAAAGAAVVTP